MLDVSDVLMVIPGLFPTELFHEIEMRDDNRAVQSILDDLLKKDVVETSFKKDLGLGAETKKKHDPRTTMAARQQKVGRDLTSREGGFRAR